MCSILGGTRFDEKAFTIYQAAKDRGRDFTGLCQLGELWICNHRATPTNEDENPNENQPFGQGFKVVHNGTIANDKELGIKDGDIDSKALALILKLDDLTAFRDSLDKIHGSYAIAVISKDKLYLACNYKPIYYAHFKGQFYFSSMRHHLEGMSPQRMKPYSVFDPLNGQTLDIKRKQHDRALIVCSGGLDSTAVMGYAFTKHSEVAILHFDYGCKASVMELKAVKLIAAHYHCKLHIIKLDQANFGASTLFDSEDIKTGKEGAEYALDWVPARNTVFLAMATALAEAKDFGYIYLGTNLEESGAYPDNEQDFIQAFDGLLWGAVQNGLKIEIVTPLGNLMKREIIDFGRQYKSPLHFSYSCYNGHEKHCGECGPCYMRKKAFERAGIEDPTKYIK